MKKILALDLGTKLGWAEGYLEEGSITDCGLEILATKEEITLSGRTRMDRRLDLRVPRLYNFLTLRYAMSPPDWVVFEDVQFSSFTQQTQLWASWRATVWLFACQRAVQVECCPVGTLKKSGSGSGTADKSQMCAALARQDHRFSFVNGNLKFSGHDKKLSDDTADAVHLLKWAQRILKNSR